MRITTAVVVLLSLGLGWFALSGAGAAVRAATIAEPPTGNPHEASAAQAHAEAEPQPYPAISADGGWAVAVLLVIAGLFICAAVVGPAVRARMPVEVPPAHSHNEPPGASHDHGPEGTQEAAGHGHGEHH